MKNTLSIEYAHIYTNRNFGIDQTQSIALLKIKEKEYDNQKVTIARHVLIDDYSSNYGIDRFDLVGFLRLLEHNDAKPDQVILESSLSDTCSFLLNKIENKKIKKSINKFYETRHIWPCSMCVAAWYLLRLGAIDNLFNMQPSENLVSILPAHFKEKEDEAIDIIMATEYKDYIKNIEVIFFESEVSEYTEWRYFDPEEYAYRHYLKELLPEDKEIIHFASDYLKKHCERGTLRRVVDIGVGPNLYPTLLSIPYLNPEATIELIDPVEENLLFLNKQLNNMSPWLGFYEYLQTINPTFYPETLRMPKNIVLQENELLSLQEEQYDLVMSFFVVESITAHIENVNSSINALKKTVKSGGILIVAHMLGSTGYPAGDFTLFPAVPLTLSDIEQFYVDLINVEVHQTSHHSSYQPQKGYKGMVIVCGQKP